MTFPKPIRLDVDNWICMRTDPVLPKAGIQRLRDRAGAEKYLLIKWDTDPAKRALMGVYASLEQANELVLYDTPKGGPDGPPNGRS
ncbi:hypothetical protein [Glaciibacter superstes]|uniref:hypothetical protein n=1 Tax=Glaciibacter superstes TaxID=501023 RepID=UPI0003B3EA8B|nr:hypothetical protein [Glaciibacter superstes]